MPDQGVPLALKWWFAEFVVALPALLPRWLGSWLLTLILLIYSFNAIKPHIRARALQLDDRVRLWARSLRWRENTDPDQTAPAVERDWLTWFFRFWTNFASAPSLCILSLIVPVWVFYERLRNVIGFVPPTAPPHEIFYVTMWWLLPGLCFTGSMLLSYVSKRIFKRVRPPIESGAFGHRLVRDPSFPSGHSLTSFCFWSMIVVSALHYPRASPPEILALAVVAVTIILLTGLSRVYMRVHFPSDVVGGWTIGIVWCGVCYIALRGVLGPGYWFTESRMFVS